MKFPSLFGRGVSSSTSANQAWRGGVALGQGDRLFSVQQACRREQVPIDRRVSPTPGGPLVQVCQFDPQHCRLNGIQAEIPAHNLVVILGTVAVVAQEFDPVGQFRIVAHHHHPVADSPQILGGEKAKAAQMSHRTGPPPPVFRADCLRCVLDNAQSMCLGNGHDGIHIRHLAIQMHGDNGFGVGRDSRLDPGGIEIVRLGINVNKDRFGAQPAHRPGRRKKGVWRSNHLIARLDPGGHQGDQEGIGA